MVMLLFALSFILKSCQKEDDIDITSKAEKIKPLPSYRSIVIPIDSVFQENKNIQKHLADLIGNGSIKSRTISSELGFSIDTSFVLKISTDSYDSYPFITERDTEGSNKLENYIITYYNDSTYVQHLVNYPIRNDSSYDFDNATVTRIVAESLVYFRQSCITVAEFEEGTCTDILCASGRHTVAEGDECSYWGTTNMAQRTCTQGGWIDDEVCTDTGGSSSGSSGSSGGGGSSGNNNNDSDNENNDNSDPDPIIVIPTVNTHPRNCNELALNSSDQTFKDRMEDLKTATEGSVEKGFGIYNGNYASPPLANPSIGVILPGTVQKGPEIPFHPSQKALVHNHLNGLIYNHIGTFSPNDILQLLDLSTLLQQNNSQVQQHEIATYLVCNEGNYALKIADDSKLYAFGLKYATNQTFRNKVNAYYDEKNIKHGKPKNDQNIGFLKLMDEFDIGVKLYEADENFENWNELKLNNFGTITPNPCS